MTTMVELLSQAAARAVPRSGGRADRHLRASRWLTAAPPTPVVLKARRRGPAEVEASIEGYVRAIVHLGAQPEPAPAPTARVLRNPRPSPVAPGPLYADHWMFHGPTFQGVRAIDALGDDGVDGQIEVLPTPGAFLDNAGQLYGWWVMATADADFLALPQSIERIEYFGPPLPTGAHGRHRGAHRRSGSSHRPGRPGAGPSGPGGGAHHRVGRPPLRQRCRALVDAAPARAPPAGHPGRRRLRGGGGALA